MQERMPLSTQQQQQQQQQQQHEESPLLQQLSAEASSPAFVRNGAGRYNRSYHRGGNNGTADRRQQHQQQPVEQVQQQVQIRDIKPIQVSVKSSEYIEAKIRTFRKGNNDVN